MPEKKTGFRPTKRIVLTLGLVILFAAAIVLLLVGNARSNQSGAPMYPKLKFAGEYRIGDGAWCEIVEGEHIPATKGDVTLRGVFHLYTPSGEYLCPLESGTTIAIYMDHVNVSVRNSEGTLNMMDNENPLYGTSACGQVWGALTLQIGEDPVELVIHNPHRYGNETAIDELVEKFSLWLNVDFERSVLAAGDFQRNLGMVFIIMALVFLGTALFSSLLHIKNSGIIWLLGLAVLAAGGYLSYSADGVSFWNESVVTNTTMVCICMVLYMLIVSILVVSTFEKAQKIGYVLLSILGVADLAFFVVPVVFDVHIYDLLLGWVILQGAVNILLCVLLVLEAIWARRGMKYLQIGLVLPLAAFFIDAFFTGIGGWKGGQISTYVFVAMFTCALVIVLQIIPRNINAANKAKELEAEKNALDAELAQSRISTMISQIRPHFIYNTLGSIEQLCELDPPRAGELVHNFAKYLRGNFGELDNPKPILMSREIEHVKYYVSIENVRFPDMIFVFEMNSVDFEIPALTIQPIVENAIKHGLMKLSSGGVVRVESYETDDHFCVSVEDNGAGFDTAVLLDERVHVGLRNIRGRLEAMVNGTLEIESTIGVGTKVFIKIPKEGRM